MNSVYSSDSAFVLFFEIDPSISTSQWYNSE